MPFDNPDEPTSAVPIFCVYDTIPEETTGLQEDAGQDDKEISFSSACKERCAINQEKPSANEVNSDACIGDPGADLPGNAATAEINQNQRGSAATHAFAEGAGRQFAKELDECGYLKPDVHAASRIESACSILDDQSPNERFIQQTCLSKERSSNESIPSTINPLYDGGTLMPLLPSKVKMSPTKPIESHKTRPDSGDIRHTYFTSTDFVARSKEHPYESVDRPFTIGNFEPSRSEESSRQEVDMKSSRALTLPDKRIALPRGTRNFYHAAGSFQPAPRLPTRFVGNYDVEDVYKESENVSHSKDNASGKRNAGHAEFPPQSLRLPLNRFSEKICKLNIPTCPGEKATVSYKNTSHGPQSEGTDSDKPTTLLKHPLAFSYSADPVGIRRQGRPPDCSTNKRTEKLAASSDTLYHTTEDLGRFDNFGYLVIEETTFNN